MKKISLTQGYFALVDDEDYRKVARFSWRILAGNSKSNPKLMYARTNINLGNKRTNLFMHHLVLGINCSQKEMFKVDHIDGNGLNNKKQNLRMCTLSQNQHNQYARKGGYSQFKGVTWHKRSRRWIAQIGNKGRIYLGSFGTEEDAAKAYDKAAQGLFGKFANLNKEEPDDSHLAVDR